jgi:ammonia channel protein AmtB
MQASKQKHSGVVALLIHAFLFNLVILPAGLLYSSLFKVDYVSFDQWVNSVVLNLITWQVLGYSLKEDHSPSGLKHELKKFTFLLSVDQWLQKYLTTPKIRYQFFQCLFWLFILTIFVIPVISKLIFDFRMPYTSLRFTFIFLQLLCFVFYYLQKKYPADTYIKKNHISSPWLLELIYRVIFKKKKY